MKIEYTSRGFIHISFSDLYDSPCSLQESSLATQAAIWLGLDSVEPKILASDAKKLGIETDATCGWIDYPLPQEVLLHTRMHLSREQASDLLPLLTKFVETGHLGGEDEQ